MFPGKLQQRQLHGTTNVIEYNICIRIPLTCNRLRLSQRSEHMSKCFFFYKWFNYAQRGRLFMLLRALMRS